MELFNKIFDEVSNSGRYKEMANFPHHVKTNCLLHCYHVALYSYQYAVKHKLKVDLTSLIRGALLHDYYLYDWHVLKNRKRFHGYRHPRIALENATLDYDLNDIEKDIIFRHMWPLTFFRFPKKKETLIVIHADHIVSLKEIFGKHI